MRLSRARSSGPAASPHTPSSVDCITTTSASEFSVHTGAHLRLFQALRPALPLRVTPAGLRADQRSRRRPLVLPGSFEEASNLAMMKVLGIEGFRRGFDRIQESYNELVRSRPKILEGINTACEAWFKNPGASQFEMLVELFKLARTHVVQK